jgi:hypothetical protein
LGGGLPVSVAGGRFVAVVTVFIQARFKDLDLLLQKPVFLFEDLDFPIQFQEQVDDPFGIGPDQV